jgi:serine/threonine protein kinase
LLEAWQFSSHQPACKGPTLPERYLGRSLGKYSVTRLLGAGAFAWVYEAIDRDLEIPVALKILRPEYAGVAGAEANFRREATTAARLRHPNIVTIRDVGTADGAVFVAMDLLPLSLARRLEVLPRLPETEVVRFALDVAAALSIAHADGIVHRDIKPDNVLIGSNGQSVVADFGLAAAFAGRAHDNLSQSPTNQVLGTPHYFSPEQARGLDVDGRADLYALGVTCYRAATGRLPFEGDDWYAVARQHIEDAPLPPRALIPELTEGFEAIVLQLLAKHPEQRFSSATQLVDALLALPTAPTGRGMSLIPTAVTQVAAPYVQRALAPARPNWPKRVGVSALGIALLAVAALFALPVKNDYSLQSLLNRPNSNRAPVVGSHDSVPAARPDSVKSGTEKAAVVVAAAPAVKRPPKPTSNSNAAKAHIELTANDSAVLWVNDVRQGRGRYVGEYLIGRPVHLRAALEGSQVECTSARRDTAITFTSAQQALIELAVEPCGVLALTIKSQDADYTLTATDFNATVTGRYTGKTIPLVLRNGTYILTVRADRCTQYTNDTIHILRRPATARDTVARVVSPLCG